MSSTPTGTTVVNGPSAAIIGFFQRIPPDPQQLPAGYSGWAQAAPISGIRWLRAVAMMKLFASGNDLPPAPLGGYGGFQGVVNSKEFRAAICIRNVRVEWDDTSGSVDFQRQVDIEEGYTPDNMWQFVPPSWQHQTRGYHKGAKRVWTNVSATKDLVTLTVIARVKLWWLYNVIQSFITFHLAPWAIVELKYTVHRAGNTTIQFIGSRIPSQFNYDDWNLHASHDMKANNVPDVAGFLTAGKCNDAPTCIVSTFP